MISPNSIDQLLNAASVEDVVGDYVNLKRSGSRFKGNCPFHDEKTPSFTVTPSLGIYKCFGCQKGGNSIQFLMDIENLSFTESARMLAKRYGIDLVETNVGNKQEYEETQKLREGVQAVNDFAMEFFSQQLHQENEGKNIAIPYFRERGFTIETIKKWNLGYSPESWDAFHKAAKKAGYKDDLLKSAGLIKTRESDGSHYDLFRNRVIFPLFAVSGKVVGFAGRIMGKVENAPKYVNSPETELYKKSDFLFALFQAKNAIKKQDKVLLTEGYTDVITLHQAGIENAVASSGTALTPGQIKLIKRFTYNATVIYDGDSAGIKASLRGIDLLLADEINVRVVPLPEGEDPDSYCKKLGPEGFQAYILQNEKNFIFFKAELLLSGAQDDPILKSDAIKDILQSVAHIADALKRNALIKELTRICDVKEEILAQELGKLLRQSIIQDKKQFLNQVDNVIKLSIEDIPQVPLTDIHQEFALIRLLLMHAHKSFDETQTVFEFVNQEYMSDESIFFKDPLAIKFMNSFFEEEGRKVWPGAEFYIRHIDTELSSFAAGVFSNDHVLSPAYLDNMIYVKTEDDSYRDAVIAIFLNIRRTKIEEIIIAEQQKLMLPDAEESIDETLEYLDYLNTIKIEIANKLGNVVSRF
jgi:DNA primase